MKLPLRSLRGARLPRALCLAALLWVAGCSRGEERSWAEETLPRLSLRARAAQLVAVPLAGDSLSAARAERWVRDDSVGAVWVAGGSAPAVRAALRRLQDASAIPLLVGTELDGATRLPAAPVLATLPDADLAKKAAAQAAAEARALGVHLGVVRLPGMETDPAATLLPVPDEGERERVEEVLEGVREGDLMAGARVLAVEGAPRDSIPLLRWDRARLEAVELPLLREAVESPVRAMLVSPVALPVLSGDSTPVPLSPVAVYGTLRRDLGFDGVVAVEVGDGSPLARRYGQREAAVRAVVAGADLLLGVTEPGAVVDALAAAVATGRISPARLEEAARRVLAAKEEAGLGAPPEKAAPPPPERAPGTAVATAAARAVRVVGKPPAAWLRGCRAPLLLARAGWTRPLQWEVAAHRPGVRMVEIPAGATRVEDDVAAAVRRSDCLLAADSTAEGGAALLALAGGVPPDTAAPADTLPRPAALVLLGAPRGLPPVESVVLAWGADAVAQRAAARALAAEAPPAKLPGGLRWPAAPVLRTVRPEEVGISAERLAAADRALRQAVESGVIPGAALAVGRRGGLVRLRGYGAMGGGRGAVDGDETLYDIASLTKVAGTTAAVMALVDEGKLRLEAPVRRYLPEFRGKWKGDVTVRHLLTHTSGLPAGEWLYGRARTPEAALRQSLEARILRPPGERMVYSDFGFILLGEIAERVAGEPLDRYLARRVYAPLGMSSTMYLPPRFLYPEIAPTARRSEREYVLRGVVHDANAFRLGGVAGHAGLFSTAGDLAIFAQTMLNGGSYGTRQIYSPRTVQRFATDDPHPDRRGLGWDKPAQRSSAGSYFSPRSFGHTGFTGTSLWIDPQRELFVVLLTNRTYTDASGRAMLEVRERVHDAVARSITDPALRPRPGSPVAREEERRARLERERKAKKKKPRPRPKRRRRG